jgi:hypothetical protein
MGKEKLAAIRDDEGTVVFGVFDKEVSTQKYKILFNTKSGHEVLTGINGNPDPFVLEMPSMIDCGVMGHCKNKCQVCYQGHISEPNMSLKDFKRLIDEVKDHTNQIALGGRGDPNHHENFKEIIEYARKNDVVPNYTTSGIALTSDQVEISKLCGAVAVSDYNAEFTDKALRMFMDAKIKTNIHTIFSSLSSYYCGKILDGNDVWDGKVDLDRLNAVIFLLFKACGNGRFHPDLIPESEHVSSFSKKLKTTKTKFKIGFDSCMINLISKYHEFEKEQKLGLDFCESSRMSVYISPNMKLVPCSFANHELFGVDLNKLSVYDAWNKSSEFQVFRSFLEKEPTKCPVGFGEKDENQI